ncbi:MAG: tyrosine-type recombinase/integrase [Xanthobacteraceae bacterium]|jgi:integrase
MSRKFDIPALIRKGGRHRYFVGKGVCLTVQGNSAIWERQWRDSATKKIRTASLGPAKGPDALSLTEARNAGTDHDSKTRNGTAPGRHKTTGKTFGEVVEEFILYRSNLPNGDAWRGGADGKEATAYRRTLKGLWETSVAAIDTPAIGDTLEKMKARTAEKTRVRVKAVLDWAKAKGYRSGENPAAKELLAPRMAPIPKAVPHPSLPWANAPALMNELAAIDTPASRALRFTILTGARTNEARGAKWKEIEGDIWTVPAGRHKEDKEHIVPLVPAALALLGDRGEPDDLIFGVMGTNAMLDLAKKLVAKLWPGLKVVVHGFRSTLSTWAAEQGYPDELAEMALSHAVGDAVQRAYQRSTRVNARRDLMRRWADFALSMS